MRHVKACLPLHEKFPQKINLAMSHVKASPIASAGQNPMSIFSRGFGLAILGWLTK